MNVPDPRSIPPASSIASRWMTRRSFAADQLADAPALAEAKKAQPVRITVVVLAPVASAIGRICSKIGADLMRDVPLVDDLIVLVDRPALGGVRILPEGTRVVKASALVPEVGSVIGRGDLLWRSLVAVDGDVVVWIDGQDPKFEPHIVTRLIAPLLSDRTISFVRGFDSTAIDFTIEIEDVVYRAGGSRLADLLGRPLLNIFFPELGGFSQPLRGPSAGRVDVLRRIPFVSGCSVDVGVLIDVYELLGLDGLAQADLAPRPRACRPLVELGPEAHAIARTILKRAEESNKIRLAPAALAHPFLVQSDHGAEAARIDEIERPPIDVLPPYVAALRSGANETSAAYAAVGQKL